MLVWRVLLLLLLEVKRLLLLVACRLWSSIKASAAESRAVGHVRSDVVGNLVVRDSGHGGRVAPAGDCLFERKKSGGS